MNYRHFLLSGSLAITSFATAALIAPAVQAQTVTSLPLEFINIGGGFDPTGFPAPAPVNGIGADITGGGFGRTIPFNPTTGGAILANFLGANVVGRFDYTGTSPGDSLEFNLSNGSFAFTTILAFGENSILDQAFNFDLSAVVPLFANTDLVVEFLQIDGGGTPVSTLSGVRLLITTTPEPGTVAGLGLLGAGLAASSLRKKSQRKNVTKV